MLKHGVHKPSLEGPYPLRFTVIEALISGAIIHPERQEMHATVFFAALRLCASALKHMLDSAIINRLVIFEQVAEALEKCLAVSWS